MATSSVYPLRVEGCLDSQLSRWLWLIKWFLVIPHYFVLAFLWMAFVVLSVVAFFSILITARYPRAIFDFNVGVLRWSWRVAYYAYGALGTDRYPPFTLREAEDYPARLEVDYPERLSRGLVLVKWWLLAIPHYLVVGVLLGGTWVLSRQDATAGAGLIAILVLISAVALAVTGRYPHGLFDLTLGLNRWVLRVAAYAGLMTDRYPPFRLDMGGSDSGGNLAVPDGATNVDSRRATDGWNGGRVVSLCIGAFVLMMGLGLAAGGGTLLWADRTQRDEAGFLSTPVESFRTTGYAIAVEDIVLRGAEGIDWAYPSKLFDDVRLRVTAGSNDSIFVGIASSSDARRYLDGVEHAVTRRLPGDVLTVRAGGVPSSSPLDETFWVASRQGPGTQTIRWMPESGSWTLVVMNTDASRGVDVLADVGARLPFLTWFAAGLLGVGILALSGGGLLMGVAISRATRYSTE